jgi:hypothetical protein
MTVAGNKNGAGGFGTGGYSGDGGQATSAQLNQPNSVFVDKAGRIYIGDMSMYSSIYMYTYIYVYTCILIQRYLYVHVYIGHKCN